MGLSCSTCVSTLSPSSSARKKKWNKHEAVDMERFVGVARIEIKEAQMSRDDKWFAVVSLGRQAFRTETSPTTDKPIWKSGIKIVLDADGPTMARISVYDANRIKNNVLVGVCDLDLKMLIQDDEEAVCQIEDLTLYDPSTKKTTVGTIKVSCCAEARDVVLRDFVKRLLAIVDLDGNGTLSITEFKDLVRAFGNPVRSKQLIELFHNCDLDKDGTVSVDELANLLSAPGTENFRKFSVNQCPVCGENLHAYDNLNDIIHMSLCLNEEPCEQSMTGGFLTDKQAANGWMFQLSEWVTFGDYEAGANRRGRATHILVFDRNQKRLVEELISNKIVLAMRAIYQSKMGLVLLDAGTKKMLYAMSERQGHLMDQPESTVKIPGFVNFFSDNINIDEMKLPLSEFKTFNEFFTRELKPGVRPITLPDNDEVAVCAGDSRLMAFNNVNDAKRFWIKGRKFSMKGLLGSKELGDEFQNGSMAIFRLAPQDYHRFHFPVSGKIEKITNIKGHLYTVNPIAVNSRYCNVFTQNKRAVAMISTKEFGEVAFVAIGATMVGTIVFTKQTGDDVKKGDEFGYFKFGGSTCICIFKENTIDFDEDLLENSQRSLETLVCMGQSLGVTMASKNRRQLARRTSVVQVRSDIAKKGMEVTDSINIMMAKKAEERVRPADDEDDDDDVDDDDAASSSSSSGLTHNSDGEEDERLLPDNTSSKGKKEKLGESSKNHTEKSSRSDDKTS